MILYVINLIQIHSLDFEANKSIYLCRLFFEYPLLNCIISHLVDRKLILLLVEISFVKQHVSEVLDNIGSREGDRIFSGLSLPQVQRQTAILSQLKCESYTPKPAKVINFVPRYD